MESENRDRAPRHLGPDDVNTDADLRGEERQPLIKDHLCRLFRESGTAVKLCGENPGEGKLGVIGLANLLYDTEHSDEPVYAEEPDIDRDNYICCRNERALGERTNARGTIKQHVIVLPDLFRKFFAEP